LPGGQLTFDTFFPSLEYVNMQDNTRYLEGEIPHPETGLPIRMYDTRRLDRVAQVQYSLNEIESLGGRWQYSVAPSFPAQRAIFLQAGNGTLVACGGLDRGGLECVNCVSRYPAQVLTAPTRGASAHF
jgi:hypothetical protein